MGFYGNVETKLKYRKRDNVYKNSTGTCMYYVDEKKATSYNWWVFVKVIKGKLVFNNYHYSSSTSGHQSAVRKLLKELKVKIDLTVYTRASLSNANDLKSCLIEDFKALCVAEYRLKNIPSSQKVKNNRKSEIASLTKNIEQYKLIGVKLSKEDKVQLKIEAINSYKSDLEKAREEAKRLREKRKVEAEKAKNLEPINLLNTFKSINNLDEVSI